MQRAREEFERGRRLLRDGPVMDAYHSLLLSADGLERQDPELAVAARLSAASAAWSAGEHELYLRALDGAGGSDAGESAPGSRETVTSPWGAYCAGLRCVMTGDFRRANALLRPALELFSARHATEDLLNAGSAALLLGDIPRARHVLGLALAAARSAGEGALTTSALEHLAYAELRAGRHHQARAHAETGLAAGAAPGMRNLTANLSAILAMVSSISGDLATVAAHARAALDIAHAHGLSQVRTLAEWAQARADLVHGHPELAAARLSLLVRPGPRRGHFGLWVLAVPCHVEATVLAERNGCVDDLVDLYGAWAAMGADPQAPAVLRRCRALVAREDRSEALFLEALDLHQMVDGPFEHARTLLAFGMWLRRRRRHVEARSPLRDAAVGFEGCGASAWAKRARDELRAAGEATGDTPQPGLIGLLTPQQLRIARKVAQGATNREIACELAISIRTVEYHLRNVFTQLRARSRVDLARLLND
ncbi:helix-turn-helix domain-containing protein [Streptomyces heilongjiangensis]|uniref:LuxR C-terminal-related transcriptional regulator n=1 Tax=Streptomyces heilongjiangensis TaxID=945052 RepID=A0ABW1B2T3_9ACTN|nr:helix-turn-helix transcriptional regulator [Streptomyces heilongjiangensis]MDC2946807.1 helix-turn-helix transcriptional regulator [Streptomyces heilongjiangensis]